MVEQLTSEQLSLLNERLPKAALKAKPGAAGFTSINAMYVVDRLNAVFGVGGWTLKTDFITMLEEQAHNKNGEYTRRMPIVKVTFDVERYGIHYECFGGNDNSDLGDAFKGSTTDALTKIGSWLGIGAGIWRGEYDHRTPDTTPAAPKAAQKDAAPTVEADVIDYRGAVITICSNNSAVNENVCKNFGVRSVGELTNEQFLVTFSRLRAKKII